MFDNSRETKILRIALPIFFYMCMTVVVQIVFSFFVTIKEFKALNSGSYFNYIKTYNFFENVDKIIGKYGLVVTLISVIVCFPFFVHFIKKDRKYYQEKENLNIFKLNKEILFFAFLIGIFASMGISKLVTLFPIDNILGSYQKVQTSFSENTLPLQIIVLVIAGPILEELLFRGIIFYRIKKYTDAITGAYISSIIFGIYHFNLVQGLYGAMLGILLSFVYEKQKSILAPIILHIGANLAALLMLKIDLSTVINNNLVLKIPIMLAEIGILIIIIYKTQKLSEREAK